VKVLARPHFVKKPTADEIPFGLSDDPVRCWVGGYPPCRSMGLTVCNGWPSSRPLRGLDSFGTWRGVCIHARRSIPIWPQRRRWISSARASSRSILTPNLLRRVVRVKVTCSGRECTHLSKRVRLPEAAWEERWIGDGP